MHAMNGVSRALQDNPRHANCLWCHKQFAIHAIVHVYCSKRCQQYSWMARHIMRERAPQIPPAQPMPTRRVVAQESA